ncbi:MAG: sigma factor-like helix-turn-helix DNA-binding protein [Eubacteriales bacterium]|nr:sigma factor-like helix-turn-helix DNA-binding protein [Eubacteriales bacterium]
MRFEHVKRIALYYKAIPGMLRLLRQERRELEEEYNGLRSTAADGTPHTSSPGKPTETMGLRALEHGVGDRLREIEEREQQLVADEASIRACLDTLNGKYKQVIVLRYVRGYSWAKIGIKISAPDSTARNWHEKAMERFGEALEELPEAGGLIHRASRART